MIRFDQRNLDVQATERVFKKVVHPSQNAIRLVDQDGIPLRTPTTQALSRLHSTYVLSPRGVPTKKSNHAYSGQLTQGKLQTLIKNMDPADSQEMQSYTSMHNYGSGLSSAGSSRHYMPSNLTPKKRGFGSGPPRSGKSMPAKSAASSRTPRYLTSAAATDVGPEPDDMVLDMDKTNDSPQGKRLEKEWSNLSQCRALKRSSEIVSHRVDRMYFMAGNKLKLQSKYHIEDDELKQLQELSQARASSRASREEMREKARTLMIKRELDESTRLDSIERKLSNIEHRLGFIEEQSEGMQEMKRSAKRSVHINDTVDVEVISRSSSESGIHEDELLRYNNSEEEDEDDHNYGKALRRSGGNDTGASERPISRVQIRSKAVSTGVQIWDILAHDKNATVADTMLKLFKAYPNVHTRAKLGYEKDEFETATELTLGVPRKIRRAKMKSARKQAKFKSYTDEKVGKKVGTGCQFCKCNGHSTRQKETVYVLRGIEKDCIKQNFPVRKPSNKVLHHAPVECECRLNPNKKKCRAPLLAVTGTQVPLCDRDYLCA